MGQVVDIYSEEEGGKSLVSQESSQARLAYDSALRKLKVARG